jgi:farnesyl-diphosphate farnesyltransferase
MGYRTGEDDFTVCEKHLDRVSRTFAVNIRVLRGDAYRSMLLAYLLFRIADTIEDEPSLEAAAKIDYLAAYENLFPPGRDWRDKVDRFTASLAVRGNGAESELLFDTPRVFREFVKLPAEYISIISERVRETARGMASFQRKADGSGTVVLEDRRELERYCYYVAGTVGLMITSLFFGGSNAGRCVPENIYERLRARSVSFGLGLQMTNIVKDFQGDRERGWCYVPRSFFLDEGIDPRAGLREDSRAAEAVLNRLVDMALEYLDEAIEYVQTIPRRFVRYRLFCLWPLLMAVETLALVRRNRDQILQGTTVKIGRNDVRRIIMTSTCAVFSNHLVRWLYNGARRKADNAISK